MLWHKGDVYDAVNKVKESQKHLCVFIRDEKTSQDCIELFDKSEELHGILNNSICLNLLKDTDEYHKFKAVYNVEEIPSIYVITHEGELIDIIKNIQNEENLCVSLRKAYGLEREELKVDNSEGSQLTSNSTEAVNATEESVNIEDKMIEVRKLLAEKHKQKAEEERQKEKEEELKRRELGRQLHQLKQTQKEQEEEEIKAQIKRKRNEEKEARDKILRQIEDDKVERKQRFANQLLTKSGNEEEEKMQLKNRKIESESGIRLLFRFPDGSSVNHTFDSRVKFHLVREFVAAHIRNNMGCYDLFEIKQFFPRRTILTTDDATNLLELQLAPSASFAVSFLSKPVKTNPVSTIINWTFAPINFLYLTIWSIFESIMSKFGAAPGRSSNNTSNVSSNEASNPVTSSTWEERQRRLLAAQSRTIMKDGNLAGFKDSSKTADDDEDEARWNGNSTQQM